MDSQHSFIFEQIDVNRSDFKYPLLIKQKVVNNWMLKVKMQYSFRTFFFFEKKRILNYEIWVLARW